MKKKPMAKEPTKANEKKARLVVKALATLAVKNSQTKKSDTPKDAWFKAACVEMVAVGMFVASNPQGVPTWETAGKKLRDAWRDTAFTMIMEGYRS